MLLLIALGAIAAVLLACTTTTPSGSPGASGGAPGQTPSTGQADSTVGPPPTDCRRRIESAKLDDPESLDVLVPCRFTEEGLSASLAVLGAGGSDDVIWAAVWVYAPLASDPAPLRPILGRDNPTLRVMAAAGLVALGDPSGFDVLAGATTNHGPLSGSHPPITIREYVVGTLFRYVAATGAPGRPTTLDERATVDRRWSEWLAANDASLVFGTENGTWALP